MQETTALPLEARPTLARPRVAVLGATGLVGREMLRLLAERDFPMDELVPLASARRSGRRVDFADRSLSVEPVSAEALERADLVLSSAGGDVSREWLPAAARAGAVCVDNTSAFRMDPEVPLVVPEVNGELLAPFEPGRRGGIIANPNCSTIQLVVALEPLRRAFGLKRVLVSTYQSVSGAGARAVERFRSETESFLGADSGDTATDVPVFDVLARIGELDESGSTAEETKMVRETPKILAEDVPLDVTCVRVPTFTGHAEAVVVETRDAVTVDEALDVLGAAPGIRVHAGTELPTPRSLAGTHEVHVGRVRASNVFDKGLQLWIVADNLLKGAAWNAVQIAERLVARGA